METPTATRADELLDLLDQGLAEAVRNASHRAEHIRLVRMQGHLAELRTLPAPAAAPVPANP